MPKVITIYWRDIPAQVNVKAGRKRAKKLLPDRFQHAIDRAAMRAKKIDADAYLEDWRRISVNKQGSDLEELVTETANYLNDEYDEERLEAIVRNKGLAPHFSDTPDSRISPNSSSKSEVSTD